MPFDSREYVVHFRLIQPVGGGGGGVLVLSPFGPFNQWGRGFAVRFGAVQPGRGGGGPWPPCPHPGDAHNWVYMLCRPCLLGGCSASLAYGANVGSFLPHTIFGGAMVFI